MMFLGKDVPAREADPMDAIVGRMVRRFIACEGEVANHRMKMTLQAYVEEARREAVRFGLDPAEVDRVAARIEVHAW